MTIPVCIKSLLLGGLLFLLPLHGTCAQSGAPMHRDPLDNEQPVWANQFFPVGEPPSSVLAEHGRTTGAWNQKGRIEVFRYQTRGKNQRTRITTALPSSRPFDGLKLKLRLRATQGGIRLAMRLVFADVTDPRTGKPLVGVVVGGTYRGDSEWQLVECTADRKSIDNALLRLRSQLSIPVSTRNKMYIDQAILLCDLNPGATEIAIDDLEFGPIVPPAQEAVFDEPVEQSRPDSNIEFRLGQLAVDGKPFFPRFSAWHNEPAEMLGSSGFNAQLIPDVSDADVVGRLRSSGVWAIGMPPPPVKGTPGGITPALKLPATQDSVLFWYLGTRIPGSKQSEVLRWSRQIRAAGRSHRRPIMADVTGMERVFSRHDLLLGMSQSVLGTTLTLRDYRDSLARKRDQGLPGSFTWSWVQAEAPFAHSNRPTNTNPYVVEPEQLRLQTYAAIASGARGIGYWKTAPLTGSRPGDRERLLMMKLLNQEMELIEPWLAGGRSPVQIDCEIHDGASGSGRLTNRVKAAWDMNRRQKINASKGLLGATGNVKSPHVQAAGFGHPDPRMGQLVLPIWYSNDSLFVPDHMTANNITLVVGVRRTQLEAWLITTTGAPRLLPAERDVRGLRIRLSREDGSMWLDQTAMVVVAPDESVVIALRDKVRQMAAESAQTWIELAEAKRQRVETVETQLGMSDGFSAATLRRVDGYLASATSSLQQSDFDGARQSAQRAMEYLRRLQHERWKLAVLQLGSPISSPHTICYQTLPDHHALMDHLSQVPPSRAIALLPRISGSDSSSLSKTGWRHNTSKAPTLWAAADFVKDTRRSHYSLRLSAKPKRGERPPEMVTTPPVRATSPSIDLKRGQIVRVTGVARLPADITGNVNGAMMYDNVLGIAGATRWRKRGNTMEFDLVREAPRDMKFHMTFVLSGIGELQIADLETRIIPARDTTSVLRVGGKR